MEKGTQAQDLPPKKEKEEKENSEGEGEEESDFDSLEGKPEKYRQTIYNARILFEDQAEAEYYDKQIIIIGHKLKDELMAGQFKKMFDFVLPARRDAKDKGDIKLYSSLVKRQLELVKEFYHIGDEAIDDAYGDIDKFEDSMVYWGEKDPKFPEKLELFMEVEAMLYHAEKWSADKKKYMEESGLKEGDEGFDPKFVINLDKIIEMNK